MAHWIIEDQGFGGQYYKCSDCGHTFNDLYHDVPDDICPECGVEINEDENEYKEETVYESAPELRLLTNDEAATVLDNMMTNMIRGMGRGCGKTMTITRYVWALMKGSHALRSIPKIAEKNCVFIISINILDSPIPKTYRVLDDDIADIYGVIKEITGNEFEAVFATQLARQLQSNPGGEYYSYEWKYRISCEER